MPGVYPFNAHKRPRGRYLLCLTESTEANREDGCVPGQCSYRTEALSGPREELCYGEIRGKRGDP